MSFIFRKKDKGDSDKKGANSLSNQQDPEVVLLREYFTTLPLTQNAFILSDTLGTGTFGRVRLVQHKVNGEMKFFALKVLRKTTVIRLKQVEHIQSEKNILMEIAHPFIVNLYATFQDKCFLYMLMEFVCGGEVFTKLRTSRRFSNDTAKLYAAEIVLAFAYLHHHDIIYRDLKPENLLIDKSGHLKIADFGFAKKIPDGRTFTLCGTPEYLAPEIIHSKGHGKPVDWWALGILIFEMLAGYAPFSHDNTFEIYQLILRGRVEFPDHFDPYAKDLIKKLLNIDRSERLGCLKGGAEDIKAHRWFKSLNWDALYQRKITPPFVPLLTQEGDTSHFSRYSDSVTQPTEPLHQDQLLFAEF